MINLIVTFTWTFNDLFVMITSIGLAEKFRQINDKIEEAFKRKVSVKLIQRYCIIR